MPRRRGGLLRPVALGLAAGEQLAGAALLADRVEAERREREPGAEEPARRGGWPSWPMAASATNEVRTPRGRDRAPPAVPARGLRGHRSLYRRSRVHHESVVMLLSAARPRPRAHRAQLHAGAELQPGAVGEAREHVDAPAEVLGPAGRCAPTGSAAAGRRAGAAAARAVVQQRGADGPSSSKRATGRRGASISWNGPARPTAPSARPRRRSRRCGRGGGPPPARGRRAGWSPSCAPRGAEALALAAIAAGTKPSAYSCACVCGSEAPASARSLTISRHAASLVRACARATSPPRPPPAPGGRRASGRARAR